MGLSVKKERGVNTSVIAPLFCPQSLDNLSIKNIQVFSATPTIPDGKLLQGTTIDGVIQLDLNLTSGYTVLGYIISGSGIANLNSYCTGVYVSNGHYRFKRDSSTYGFYVNAICVKF